MKHVFLILGLLVIFHGAAAFGHFNSVVGSSAGAIGEQPLSKIAIHKTKLALRDSASIKATPLVLGIKVSKFLLFTWVSSHIISLFFCVRQLSCGFCFSHFVCWLFAFLKVSEL